MNGYDGLINGNFREMSPDEFSGILTVGGTILGTKRTPFKKCVWSRRTRWTRLPR